MPTVFRLVQSCLSSWRGAELAPRTRQGRFWFDILDRKLLEMGLDDAAPQIHDLPFHATVAAPRRQRTGI